MSSRLIRQGVPGGSGLAGHANIAATINGVPPVLPGPVADAMSNLNAWVTGPLNAVFTIGGGTFLVGIGLIVTGLASRTRPETEMVADAAVE